MNQMYENWSQMTKNSWQPFNEWLLTMTKMGEILAREQIQFCCDCMGICLKGCQEAAGPNVWQKTMEKSMDCMKNMVNAYGHAMEETRKCCESHMAKAKSGSKGDHN